MKKLLLILAVLFFYSPVHAQSEGDMLPFANGNWSDPIWDVYSGGHWQLSSYYPGQWYDGASVYIPNNMSITLDVSPVHNLVSLTIQQGAYHSYLNFNSGTTLNVSGTVSLEAPLDYSRYKIINVGDGILNCADLTMADPGAFTGALCALKIGSGSVNISGNIVMNASDASANQIWFSGGTGILNMNAGTITGGSLIYATGSTVAFNGSSAQSIGAYNYYNLTINSGLSSLAGAATLAGSTSINGDLSVSAGKGFNLNGHKFTIAGSDRSVYLDGNLYCDGAGAALLGSGANSTLIIHSGGQLHLLAPGGTTLPGFSNYQINATDGYVVYGAADDQPVGAIEYGILCIAGGGTKTVTGHFITNDLLIKDNATLFSNIAGTGNIEVERQLSFTNNGALNSGDDTLSMMGSVDDGTINVPAAESRNLFNLVINKGAAKKVILTGGDLDISGGLSLSNGLFDIAANKVTLSNATDASQLTGGSASSYVIASGTGRLIRKLQNSLTQTFPVGTAGNFLPATVYSYTSPGDYAVNVYEGATTNGLNSGTAIADKSCIVDAVWNIERLSGSGSATIGLYWKTGLEGACFSGYPDGLIGISHYNGSSWDNAIQSSASNSSDYVIADFSSFSPFGIGKIGYPLPVKFGSIRAYEKQQGIQIDWNIYSEDKISNYMVERSANGSIFSSIGSVASRNSITATDYGFFDASPLAGTSFYRIRSIDLDGKSGISGIVRVSLDKKNAGITLYPNPVFNRTMMLQSANLAKGNYTLRIFNASGVQVMQQSFVHAGGALTFQPQLNNSMPAGMYNLDIECNGVKLETKKFTIQ